MFPPFAHLWLHRGAKEGKTVVEICENCTSLHTIEKQNLSKPYRLVVKMRGSTERNLRGGLLKDRHVVAVALESTSKCKACSKHIRGGGGGSADRTRSLLWRQHAKGGLLCFSLLFLFIIMLRPDWLPLFSDSQAVQLIPPLLEPGNSHSTAATMDSDSSSLYNRPRRVTSFLELKEERSQYARPRGELKDVHRDDSILQRDDNSTDKDNGHRNPLGLSSGMKIFIYDLPSTFNENWLKDERCSNHLFAAEVAIHQRLLHSPVRTLQPLEADFFFMPVYVSCNFSTTSGFPSLGHARALLGAAVKLVSHEMPYWNRRRGKDHVFVATHDYGPCFHTMEDLAVAAGIPTFLRKSVILQTFGRMDKHACQADNRIQIPPFVQPPSVKPGWLPELQHRNIWAFFRGKMEIHPKNVSGRIYSRGVRSTIWQKFRRDRRFFIKRTRSPDYQSEIRRSVFCLCPLGWAPWSPRIVESVILGCVPVIIADKIALPYSHIIDWAQISLTVPEKDVSRLGKILDKVSHTNLSTIQENLWNKEYRQALLYMDPFTGGDATWQVLELLSRKLTKRSNKSLQTV